MPISRGACRDFLEDFSSFVDGTLDARRRSLLLAHLDCCEACLRHLRAYRKGVAAFRDTEPREPARGLYDRVVERLGEERRESIREVTAGATMDRGAGPALGAVGAALVMAVLALFVLVPQAGRIGPPEGGPDAGTAAPASTAPTSWASVIPSALPLNGIGQGAAD
ncbi:MAG: anti-sigma factor family protein, partial [Gemmatimonadota bacterium]